MRIALPTPSWSDTVLRVDEDAHTLTLAEPSAGHSLAGSAMAEPHATLRVEVPVADIVVLTLTL